MCNLNGIFTIQFSAFFYSSNAVIAKYAYTSISYKKLTLNAFMTSFCLAIINAILLVKHKLLMYLL